MDIPWIRGKVAQQAHVGLPEGTVEDEYGRDGFFGRYAHLYRTHAPVGWTRIEGPCRPRAFDLAEVPASRELSRRPILENADVTLSVVRLEAPMDAYARNADGDELYFVHAGAGRLETDFGPLAYAPGDYLVNSLQGIVPDGAQCTGSMWAAAFQFDGSIVNLRAGAPSPQGMLLPPDFNALPLAKPAVMMQAEARLKANQSIGFVDTDCIREVGQVFEADALLAHYKSMQKLTSATFKAAMSSLAQKEWM